MPACAFTTCNISIFRMSLKQLGKTATYSRYAEVNFANKMHYNKQNNDWHGKKRLIKCRIMDEKMWKKMFIPSNKWRKWNKVGDYKTLTCMSELEYGLMRQKYFRLLPQ